MFMTEYDEKETMRRLARDEREDGRKEDRTILKQATEYLLSQGRESEIINLVLDDRFYEAVLKEAGLEYLGDWE